MDHTSASNLRLGIDASSEGAFWLAGVLMLAGLFPVIDAIAANLPSTILFGLALLAAGGFEIVHALWLSHGGAVLFKLLLGLFYLICGGMLIAYPLASSSILSIAFAAALMASGVVRACLAREYWQKQGRWLLASGIVGILAGLVVLLKWPIEGVWALGLVVGIDLLVHGAWWMMCGVGLRRQTIDS